MASETVQYKLVHPEQGEFCRSHQDDSEDPVIGEDLKSLLSQVAEVCDYGDAEDLADEFDGGVLTGYVPVREVVTAYEATEAELEDFRMLVGLADR